MTRKHDPPFTIQVSVTHGDLRFARYPVAVGHYRDDNLVSAERYLDQRLGGRLGTRLVAGLYPERAGAVDVVYAGDGNLPPGALIIGLGEFGEITRRTVREGVAAVALRHALAMAESASASTSGEPVGISSLLIGTFGGRALAVEDSVAAILEGVLDANRRLQVLRGPDGERLDRVRIGRIELIELYEDLAIQAIRALHRLALPSAPDLLDLGPDQALQVVPPELVPVGGGKYQRPTEIYAQGWWRRIQITATAAHAAPSVAPPSLGDLLAPTPEVNEARRGLVEVILDQALTSPEQRARLVDYLVDIARLQPEDVSPAGGLEFLVLTDRARAEASLHQSQRELVDRLIAEAVYSTDFNPQLSNTLYQLLLPNHLKARAENVVLILDRVAAGYPWELLGGELLGGELLGGELSGGGLPGGEPPAVESDPAGIPLHRRGVSPLAVKAGILRQFRTSLYRSNPLAALARRALIIGDTRSGFAPLPGAQAEARAVANLLDEHGYQTVPLIESDGRTIVNELFARDYQILHLAAHGLFDPANPEQSGVVLGDGIFLTSRELNSLRRVPELVFLNCCHLGQLDPAGAVAATPRNPDLQPNLLAASLAEQLMRMGVKAVVAAGWAVDDEAAATFATTLYRQLLAGRAYGEAVLEARQLTWRRHPATNTWGAFQCYGSPAFHLAEPPAEYGFVAPADYYSRHEYLQGIRDLAARADAADREGNRRLAARLDEIVKRLPAKLRTGEMLTAIGEAWAALDRKSKAITALRAAINAADATASLAAIERCANLECRLAEELIERPGKSRPDQLLEKARKRIELLLELDPQNQERRGLRARLTRLEALLAPTRRARVAALRALAEDYRLAGDGSWMRTVWLGAEVLLHLLGEQTKTTPRLTRELDRLYQDATRRFATTSSPDFWEHIAPIDADLLRALHRGQLAEREQDLLGRYRAALEIRPTPLQLDSVRRQIRFIRIILERSRVAEREASALAGILRRLK